MIQTLLLVAVLLGGCLSGATAISDPIVWKIQSNQSAKSLKFKQHKHIVSEIERLSNGQLQFQLLPVNGYVGNRQAFNSTRVGTIDAMFMSPQYWGSSDPIFTIMGDLVAAWKSPDQYRHWLGEQNGIAYLERAYQRKGLKLIGYALIPIESLVSTKPIRNAADFADQLMRVPPGMMSDLFRELGARPRKITLDKVVKALQRGQVTLADYSTLQVNYQRGLYSIAKYTNYPGFHSMPLSDFVVNEKRWQSLTAQQQQLISTVADKWHQRLMSDLSRDVSLILSDLKAQGVEVHTWREQDIRQVREQAVQIWEQYASRSTEATQLVAEIESWLKKIGNLK